MKIYTEGEVLKVLRERFQPRAGETQTQTAANLGVSVSYIQMMLNGQRSLTENVANALGFREQPRTFVRVK
jgi:plasmid maintenance system antidote protein VapI